MNTIAPLVITFLLSLIFLLTKFLQFPSITGKRIMRRRLPPGPKPWPIIGNLPEFLKNKPKLSLWIHNLMKRMNTDIACFRLGSSIHVITVTCPEISRQFLQKHDAVFASRPFCTSVEIVTNGYSMVVSRPLGDEWKKGKKILSGHLISPARLQWMAGKREEEADNLVRYVYNQCGGGGEEKTGVVNVRTAARHYCANVTRKTVFGRRNFGAGREDGGPGVEEEEHVNALFIMLLCIYSFSVSDYLSWLSRFDIDGLEKKARDATMVVAKYHDPIVEERIGKWEKGVRKEEEDLLDVMINTKDAEGKSLFSSENEVKGVITEMMMATVDNPSNALEWALAEMLNQPEIFGKAIEELDRVVGKDRLVQESDIPQLNYVKACAREAFRLHPLDPFNLPHESVADATVCGYFIPKGSRVLLSRIGLGRNPNVWEEPLKFKPERHLKNDGAEVVLTEPDLRFISFSYGRRGCPGIALGTTMTIMLFARLLQGFDWTLPLNQSKIDLDDFGDVHSLAKPLVAMAKPRLPNYLYRSSDT